MWTDDPVFDAERYMAEQEAKLDKLPVCVECENPITTDECYELDNGLVCPDCLIENHRKWVEDFIE